MLTGRLIEVIIRRTIHHHPTKDTHHLPLPPTRADLLTLAVVIMDTVTDLHLRTT